MNGKDTSYYRHPIHEFSFTALDGKEKWTAYKFTKNVYDIWMPTHFKSICSVIDKLPPDINFEVSELQSSEASGLSQANSTSLAKDDSQSSLAGSITPNTSLSHGTERGAFKLPKKRCTAG